MMGEGKVTLTITEYEREIKDLYNHFKRIQKKYDVSPQQIMVEFGALGVRDELKLVDDKSPAGD
jgi:hypothetical protein